MVSGFMTPSKKLGSWIIIILAPLRLLHYGYFSMGNSSPKEMGYGATTELALLKYPLSSMELHFQIFQVRI